MAGDTEAPGAGRGGAVSGGKDRATSNGRGRETVAAPVEYSRDAARRRRMWVLALDTTTREGSVAVVRDDTVVLARPGTAGVSHAERVPADLRAALGDAGITLAQVHLLAVASGPGAFTGLRIGLAAMQGLALAAGRPVIGVPALDAWAWGLLGARGATTAGAWLDASRGEVFAAAFETQASPGDPPYPLPPLVPACAASPDEILAAWHPLVPPGTPIALAGDRDLAGVVAAAGYVPVAPEPLAALVGRLAARAHRAGLAGTPAALAPVYVRRPDVEIERERQRAAAPPA